MNLRRDLLLILLILFVSFFQTSTSFPGSYIHLIGDGKSIHFIGDVHVSQQEGLSSSENELYLMFKKLNQEVEENENKEQEENEQSHSNSSENEEHESYERRELEVSVQSEPCEGLTQKKRKNKKKDNNNKMKRHRVDVDEQQVDKMKTNSSIQKSLKVQLLVESYEARAKTKEEMEFYEREIMKGGALWKLPYLLKQSKLNNLQIINIDNYRPESFFYLRELSNFIEQNQEEQEALNCHQLIEKFVSQSATKIDSKEEKMEESSSASSLLHFLSRPVSDLVQPILTLLQIGEEESNLNQKITSLRTSSNSTDFVNLLEDLKDRNINLYEKLMEYFQNLSVQWKILVQEYFIGHESEQIVDFLRNMEKSVRGKFLDEINSIYLQRVVDFEIIFQILTTSSEFLIIYAGAEHVKRSSEMLLSQCRFEEKQKIDQSLLGSIFSMIAESGIEYEDETDETEETEETKVTEMKEEKNEEMDDKNPIQNESETKENHNDMIDDDEEKTSSLRFGEVQKNHWNYILKDYENMKSIVIF